MTALTHYLSRLPGRVAAVAGVTVTQLVRMRLFLVLAVFLLAFLGLQFIPFHENVGIEFRGARQLQLIKDVAMGCMQLFALIFSVAAAALLIPRDVEDRILYTILCKPVPRFDYLLGKALGVILLMAAFIGLMDGLLCLILHLRESMLAENLTSILTERGLTQEQIAPYLEQLADSAKLADMQKSLLAMLLGFSVLTTLTLLYSCFTSGTIVSMVFALGSYFIGMFQGQFFHAITAGDGVSPALQRVQQVCSILLPDFGLFALADTAGNGVPLSWGILGGLAAIAAGYMLLHLLTAAYLFSRKEY